MGDNSYQLKLPLVNVLCHFLGWKAHRTRGVGIDGPDGPLQRTGHDQRSLGHDSTWAILDKS